MKIEVFPTVGAVTIEMEEAQLEIRQECLNGERDDAVYIPRSIIAGFLGAVVSQLSWDELHALNQLCEAEARVKAKREQGE